MGRQEQIERICELIKNLEHYSADELAEHLIDAGIGDKDRFEIADETHPLEGYILPIDYKEEDGKSS